MYKHKFYLVINVLKGFNQLRVLFFFLLVLSFIGKTQAQTLKTIAASTTWSAAAILSTDSVVLSKNVTLTVDVAAASCQSITFDATTNSGTTTEHLILNNGVTLTISGGLRPGMGKVTVGDSSTIALAAGSTSATINCSFLWHNNQSTVGSNGTSQVRCAIYGVTLNVTNDVTIFSTGATKTNLGGLQLNSGTLNVGTILQFNNPVAGTTGTFAMGAGNAKLSLKSATNFGNAGAGGANNFVLLNASGTVDYSGTIAQTIFATSYFNLIASGSNTKTLSANTTLAGSLTVRNGATLALSTFTLGAPTSLTMETGATGSSITGTGALTLGGNVVINSNNGVNGASITCPISLGATRTFTIADDASATNDLSISGIVSGATFGITKLGLGKMVLSGTNTFTGITTINSGTLSVASIGNGGIAGNLGQASNIAANLVLGGGVLEYTGITSSSDRSFTLTTGTNSSINITANTLSISGSSASSTGALTKIGAGTLTLSGVNAHTGGTTLNGGTLNINSTSALGTAAGTFTIISGTIDNTSAASITTNNYPLALSGDFTFTGTNALNLGTGNITLSANRIISVSASTLTLGGVINDNTKSLTKSGAGILSLGSNAITINSLTISAGTFTSTSNTLSLAGNLSNSGTFNNNNGTVLFNGTGAQTITGTHTFSNLSINSTGGVSSANNITVIGVLTLTSVNPSTTKGTLDMGANTLLMGATATTSGIYDVSGIVSRSTIAASTPYTFGNSNTKLIFSNTGTLPSSVSVKITINPVHTWKTNSINRYYDFIRTGGDAANTVDIQLAYQTSELNGVIENSNIDFFDYLVATQLLRDLGHSSEDAAANWIGLGGLSLTSLISGASFDTKYLTLAQSTDPNLYTWLGSNSTDWNNATNWDFGIPQISSDVIIPNASTTNFDPTLPASTSINSLSLASGAILNGGSATTLTIAATSTTTVAAWMNDNAVFNAGSSTLVFTGTNSTIGGTNTFNNLTINTGASSTISGSALVNMLGTLTVNGTFTTSGNLILKGNTTNPGRIGASSGSITGNVNVEIAIPAGRRAYRLLSHPFSSASSLNSLIDDIHITGLNGSSNGFDPTVSNSPSAFSFNESTFTGTTNTGWTAFTNISNSINSKQVIRVLFRGPRSQANLLDDSKPIPQAATLNWSGPVNQGSVSVGMTFTSANGANAGWNLIPNPYPSAINVGAITSANRNAIT